MNVVHDCCQTEIPTLDVNTGHYKAPRPAFTAGTSIQRRHLQWSKHTLVKWTHHSLRWLLTTIRDWTWNNSQKEEKKAKQSYKIFPTGGSWPRAQSCSCPHKHHSHPSLYLFPLFIPRSVAVPAAHSPDVAHNRPQGSFQHKLFGEGLKDTPGL